MTLPAAPSSIVGADGRPHMGRFAGLARHFDWHRLGEPHARGPLWRRLHGKRWHFVALTTGEVYCAVAVVDIGWGSSTFGYIFERATGRDLNSFSLLGLPGMGAQVGGSALAPSGFRWFGGEVTIVHELAGHWSLNVRARGLTIEATYGGPGDSLLAVGPAAGGGLHATQKSAGMALRGTATAGGRRFVLDDGVASFDYSNGLLGRRTAWCWLSAHGPGLGINLQQGYFGDAENALWLAGKLLPLGTAVMAPESDACSWRVRTADGLADLRFTCEGTRRDDKQLLLASSRLRQQIGTFDGWVKPAADAPEYPVKNLVGVIEQHRARW